MALNDKESTAANPRKPTVRKTTAKSVRTNAGSGSNKSNPKPSKRQTLKTDRSLREIPNWVGITASVVGAGLAAGFLAWRQFKASGSSTDDFNAAFADGETDSENFDQTRNAGKTSMRSDNEDASWDDVDEMADASFPASDPPSFNPGTA